MENDYKTKLNLEETTHLSPEIKDARLIFNTLWRELEEEYGHEKLCFPKEIILLGGAPGSGKGTQTDFIMQARGFSCDPVVVSDLLTTPEAEKIKAEGGMVGDKEVIGLILREILKNKYRLGVLIDGFPRTKVQVECLKLLVEQINQLHQEFRNTPDTIKFRRPTIHIMVLYVSERTSVERQLYRGKKMAEERRKAQEVGEDVSVELRQTDASEDTAYHRYKVFKEMTWDALQSLKEIYHYHFINAEGSIENVQTNILNELTYQSSLELDPQTFDRVRNLPLASEIILHARQELVNRLDSYELERTELFSKVVDLLNEKFIPVIQRQALSGMAIVHTDDVLLNDSLAVTMLIDILTERGFHAIVDKNPVEIPEKVDLITGVIFTRQKNVFRIRINFTASDIRRG